MGLCTPPEPRESHSTAQKRLLPKQNGYWVRQVLSTGRAVPGTPHLCEIHCAKAQLGGAQRPTSHGAQVEKLRPREGRREAEAEYFSVAWGSGAVPLQRPGVPAHPQPLRGYTDASRGRHGLLTQSQPQGRVQGSPVCSSPCLLALQMAITAPDEEETECKRGEVTCPRSYEG